MIAFWFKTVQSPLIKVVEADAASQEGRATAAQHYHLKRRSDNHTLKWMVCLILYLLQAISICTVTADSLQCPVPYAD